MKPANRHVPHMFARGGKKIHETLEPALPYMNEHGCKNHKKPLGRHCLYMNARGGKKCETTEPARSFYDCAWG